MTGVFIRKETSWGEDHIKTRQRLECYIYKPRETHVFWPPLKGHMEGFFPRSFGVVMLIA